ncbi:cytochrome P450 [Daedaleopsis nitida]|nr:cytochrome P450 [Daedaleopsis nitida]
MRLTTGVSQALHTTTSVPWRERVLTSYGRVFKIPMLFGDIELAVSDPQALTTLFGTYRDTYDNPEYVSETMNSVFGPGLLSVRGKEHTKQRKQLNPVFSVRYLRDMVPMINAIAQELVSVLRKEVPQPGTEVDVSQFFSRYSLECIGRSGLGYSFGPLENHGTDYSFTLREFGPTLTKLGVVRRLLPWIRRTFPTSWLKLATEVLPWGPLRSMRRISDRVCMIAMQVVRHKVELLNAGGDSLAKEIGEGKDLMSVLLRETYGTGELSEDSLIGHMSLLILAGTDTTSTTLSRAIELLSHRPDIQQKLRQEVNNATHGVGRSLSEFDFDAYAELPYLEAVVRETIRMYPSFYLIPRVANEDTVLPLSTPITCPNGQSINELVVPSGTLVWVNIFGLNRDKDVWGPDADEWKPERWLAPLPPSVADAHIPNVFANTSTFLAGPRACIGYNMALMELRIALAHLAMTFEFAPSQKEIIWKLGTIVSPWVNGSTAGRPELPVLVSSTS